MYWAGSHLPLRGYRHPLAGPFDITGNGDPEFAPLIVATKIVIDQIFVHHLPVCAPGADRSAK